MVGEHFWQFVNVHPLHVVLLQQAAVVVLHVDERIVGNGNHTGSRVTVHIAEGSHLTHINVVESRQFEQRAVGSSIQALAVAHEASVETPCTTTGIHIAVTYQHLELVVLETEDDAIDGKENFLMFNIVFVHYLILYRRRKGTRPYHNSLYRIIRMMITPKAPRLKARSVLKIFVSTPIDLTSSTSSRALLTRNL